MNGITTATAYKDGHVGIRVELQASGYGPSIKMQARTEISTSAARELAAALIAHANEADAKVAKKAAAEVRRQQWRDREVAAGRMRIMKW
jgi:hypothetical protein